MTEADGNRYLPLTGYLDRLSARPGEHLSVKVSAVHEGAYEASVVRVRSGDPNPEGPGIELEPVSEFGSGTHRARFQPIQMGSFAHIDGRDALAVETLTLAIDVQPWLPRAEAATVFAYRGAEGAGWCLDMTDDAVRFTVHAPDGEAQSVSLACQLKRKHWYRIWAGYDRVSRRLRIGCRPIDSARDGTRVFAKEQAADAPRMGGDGALTLAARYEGDGAGVAQFFNGRLEAPSVWAAWAEDNQAPPEPQLRGKDALIARWDFARGIETQSVLDDGPHGLHGRLVNVPMRGVRGARWTGASMCWRTAPEDYAAIHFHEDDLYDCGWETDFTLSVPEGTPSGIYCVRLRMGDDWDLIPFYVLPPKGQVTADVCFLASTFTYQAYGNHARGNCDEAMRRRIADWGAYPHNPDDYPIYGGSTYNSHPDGSGYAYSSRLRPLLTMRPGFLTFVDKRGSGLRHFPADTHLVKWFEQSGIPFDVVTDEDLDAEGVDLIKDYSVVLTGSHPEYHTQDTLDALSAYTATGGNFVYLGGNGFYWKIARSETLPGMIEVRRGEGGIRIWASDPGEYYNALDGSYGGLWRRNGRPPQMLGGVGFSAQGMFEGSYYRRLPASHDPAVAWVFDGVAEETFGGFGLSGGGAAGFELDRADVELGTPDNVWILARSEGHSHKFVPVPEEILTHVKTVTGEDPEDLVRGEIVYFTTPGGGQVCAVGSITFCGSLPVNGGDNDISRILRNIVERFRA